MSPRIPSHLQVIPGVDDPELAADTAAMAMHRDMRDMLHAAVDTLLEQHPILLTTWAGSGFPMTRAEFAGEWLNDVAVSTKLHIAKTDREAGAA